MNETAFDKEMKEMLHQCADELHAPDKLKTRVDFELKNGSIKPRHRWGRRLVALAAVAAIAVTGAFAAGAFGSIRSSSRADQSLSMEQTQQHMEDAGASLTLPETIGDFTFSHGYDIDTTAESAMGKTEKVSEVNAEYEKDGVTLNFNAHKTYTVFSDEENSDPEPDEVQEVNGVTREYYILKLPVRSMVVMVPTEHSGEIGVRPVVGSAAADRILASISQLPVEAVSSWNRRYRMNMERMKSGNLFEVARVVKSLTLRENDRGLSTGERKMLHAAKQILISELVMSKDSSYEDMEEQINMALG